MAPEEGIEPSTRGVGSRRSATELLRYLVPKGRIELPYSRPQRNALPLSYEGIKWWLVRVSITRRQPYEGRLDAGPRAEEGIRIERMKAASKAAGLPLTEPSMNWCSVAVPTRLRRCERAAS